MTICGVSFAGNFTGVDPGEGQSRDNKKTFTEVEAAKPLSD
jgi:hypothetical protein